MTDVPRSIEQLKKDAKRIKHELGISHTEALHRVAAKHGFSSWEDLVAKQSPTYAVDPEFPVDAFAGLLSILGDLRGTDTFSLDKPALSAFRERYLSRFRDATRFIPNLIATRGWFEPDDSIIRIVSPDFAPSWLGRWEILPSRLLKKDAPPAYKSMMTALASPKVYLDLLGEAHYEKAPWAPPQFALALQCNFDAEIEVLDMLIDDMDAGLTLACKRSGAYVVRATEDSDLEYRSPQSIAHAVHQVSRKLLRSMKDDPSGAHGGLAIEVTLTAESDPLEALSVLNMFLITYSAIEMAFNPARTKTKIGKKRKSQ